MEANWVASLHQLEAGLTLRDQQLDTGIVGRLDLLAVDKEAAFVVIELKAGRADDRAVAQTMRYMGWSSVNLRAGSRCVGS